MRRPCTRAGRTVTATLACIATLGAAAGTSAQVPSPLIEGPIASPEAAFVASTTFDLAAVGYEQAEYFISGVASAYVNTAPLDVDGRWALAAGDTAAYESRLLVYRPTNPKKFRGTVVIEWLNVSAGLDSAPDWTQGHVELVRQGAVKAFRSAHRKALRRAVRKGWILRPDAKLIKQWAAGSGIGV